MANELLAGRKLTLEHRRKSLEAKIESLRAEFNAEKEEYERVLKNESLKTAQAEADRQEMLRRRQGSTSTIPATPNS